MARDLVTVDQAAQQLNLHPKTVLRYIREGRLPATKIGKSFRIEREKLRDFAGISSDGDLASDGARATCIVDIPQLTERLAQRLASFINAAASAADARSPSLHVTTTYDTAEATMKIVMVASPSDVAKLLELIQLQLGSRD